MSDQTRVFPEQPNLRFLKLEAKRRLAAGEFATLHDAQLAVAREHGLSSWAALKEFVTADMSLALPQVRWLIARFQGADGPGWAPPDDDELREREELVVTQAAGLGVRAQIGGARLEAAAEPDPPNRLAGRRHVAHRPRRQRARRRGHGQPAHHRRTGERAVVPADRLRFAGRGQGGRASGAGAGEPQGRGGGRRGGAAAPVPAPRPGPPGRLRRADRGMQS